jgi:hypothetical protein
MAEGNVSKEPRTSPPVRISYPQIFTPKTFKAGDTPRFGLVFMIDKKSKEQMDFMKQLHKDASEALVEKWPDEAKRPRIPLVGHDKSLFKDGDTACNNSGIPLIETNAEYAGHYIVRAGSTSKPGIANRAMQEIIDFNEIYGGCWCKVNVNAYTFVQPQNKGVTLGINGVQKWTDGESFGAGRPPLDEMFTPDSGADDPANYPNPFADEDDIPF